MSQIQFKGHSASELISWLKKFSSVEKTLLFEIDTQTEEFIGKSHADDKSVVKMSRVSFSDLKLEFLSKTVEERIKVGLYDIASLNKILSQFTGEEFELIFKYDRIIDPDSKKQDLGSLSILVKSEILKAGIECTSLRIFNYLSDEIFETKVSHLNSVSFSFDLKKKDIERILSLSDLDKEFKKITFQTRFGSIYSKGKGFELKLGITDSSEDFKFPIMKSQFIRLDPEDYNVKVGDKIVFNSTESNSTLVLGMLIENEYDSEKELDLDS